MSNILYIFADGSCSAHSDTPDGDIGAWAVVLAGSDGYRKILYGVDFPTTISKCEILPILNAFTFIDKFDIVKYFTEFIVMSDSEFVIKTLSKVYKEREYTYLLRAIENYEALFANSDVVTKYIWRERNSHPFMKICDAQAYALRNNIIEAMKNLSGKEFLAPATTFGLDKIELPKYEEEQID